MLGNSSGLFFTINELSWQIKWINKSTYNETCYGHVTLVTEERPVIEMLI